MKRARNIAKAQSLNRYLVLRILFVMALAGALELGLLWMSTKARFDALELDLTSADAARIEAALDAEVVSIRDLVRDYASWDEARDFLLGANPGFARENFNAEWLDVAAIERVAILNLEADIVWSCLRAAGSFASSEEPAGLPDNLKPGARVAALRDAPRNAAWSAFGESSPYPLLSCAYPVTDSSYEGPTVGWIMFTRRLDAAMERRISDRTGLSAAISGTGPQQGRVAIPVPESDAVYYDEGSRRTVSFPINNAAGLRIATVRTIRERQLDAPAILLISQTLGLLVIATSCVSVVLLVLLRRRIVKPLVAVAGFLQARADSDGSEPGLRLGAAAGRRDEIGIVADRIDELFAKLAVRRAELKRANDDLARLASVDFLTGLANRRSFDSAATREVKRLSRIKRDNRNAGKLAVVLADIDHFKRYNDRHGHLAGDQCLLRIATAIADSAKRPADLPCRFGGEEFVVLLPDTDLQGASVVAEHIRASVEELLIPHGDSPVSPWVTISLGIAAATVLDGFSPEDLVGMADKALYRAKDSGRNRVST